MSTRIARARGIPSRIAADSAPVPAPRSTTIGAAGNDASSSVTTVASISS